MTMVDLLPPPAPVRSARGRLARAAVAVVAGAALSATTVPSLFHDARDLDPVERRHLLGGAWLVGAHDLGPFSPGMRLAWATSTGTLSTLLACDSLGLAPREPNPDGVPRIGDEPAGDRSCPAEVAATDERIADVVTSAARIEVSDGGSIRLTGPEGWVVLRRDDTRTAEVDAALGKLLLGRWTVTAVDGRAASAELVARQRLFWRPDDDEGVDYWVAGGRLWYVGRTRAFLRGLPRETSADGRPGPLRNGMLVAVDATHLRLAGDRGSVDAVRP